MTMVVTPPHKSKVVVQRQDLPAVQITLSPKQATLVLEIGASLAHSSFVELFCARDFHNNLFAVEPVCASKQNAGNARK